MLAEQAQAALMAGKFAQAPSKVVATADGLELVIAAAFIDEQWYIARGIYRKAIEQLTAAGAALASTAVLLLEQMQAAV
ncbi:hypothetical protein D3C77_576220 [compost metagenome]